MKKYKLQGLVTISIYTTIEANNLKEAIEEAEDRNIESYHMGSHSQEGDVWVADGYDGTPVDVTEEE